MIRQPTAATLRKYGLTLGDWQEILERQDGRCAVCWQVPSTGRLCIDHEHVRGYAKMKPERRKQYVRGLVCWFDNHYYLGRGITLQKALGVVRYLEQYEERNNA